MTPRPPTAPGRPSTLVPGAIADDRYLVENVGDPDSRDVVFGGQLMAQMVVLAADRNPGKDVKTIHIVFPRVARVSRPVEMEAASMHAGRAFASETMTAWQDGRLCARALVLLSADEPDVIRHTTTMPSVVGPEASAPQGPTDVVFPGAEVRVVGGIDTWDVDAPVGPAELNVWMRYRGATDELCVSQAVLAYATDGFLIGAAMRPHEGFGQDRAHVDLSTGVISHTMTFHEPFDVAMWCLIANEVVSAGRGRVYGRGNVFTENGTLVASFVQDSMVRFFGLDVSPEGQRRTVM
jgi:acyl-CoA thioesterase-2